jgi:uncharacterized membrane protein
MLKSIRNNILVGLILVTPIVVTSFVVNWLFTFITNRVLVFLPKHYREGDQEILWRLASLVLVLVLVFLVGVLVRNILGKRLYQIGDRLLGRIPLVSRIYVGTRQVIEALFQQRQTLFQDVVLLEYPRPGVIAMGFVTAVVPAGFRSAMPSEYQQEECVSVFIPTTPNPTSGWFCMIPRSKTIKLNMTSGEAMKLIMSGGAVFPGETSINKVAPPSLLEMLHEWAAASDRAKDQEPKPPSAP